jgi:filamentous hemagglutinin family protein
MRLTTERTLPCRNGNARSLGVGLAAALAGALCVAAAPAFANPKGGRVVAGSATIDQVRPTWLDITQSTERAIIDWQSFNIAPSQWTEFQQPGAGAVTLNRVMTGDPSVIAGRLTANGSIVLIDASGITFSRGAQVNVNSLIATPTGIGNANFMAGRMRFDRPSADPRARVVNRGSITVAEHGLAALVAPEVANSGVIRAKLGRVVVAGAETYTVDLYGDGLIAFDVGPKVTEVPIGPGGRPVRSLVSNNGLIAAPGGTVLLTADAAAGIIRNVVADSGMIDARTIGTSAGSVTIDAGPGGGANLSGTIDVSGRNAGEKGGSATVTGHSVEIGRGARIDASGYAGGGIVQIGGGAHGRNPRVRDAATTMVARGARIDASAIVAGDGGLVTVWSDWATRVAGTVRARGGRLGGNGGWIETSGHWLGVAASAIVSARAPSGKGGSWLLDPANLTVTDKNVNITPPNGMGHIVRPIANNAMVDARAVSKSLASNNVTLTTFCTTELCTQVGNLTVSAGSTITWSSTNALILHADHAIVVDGSIHSTHGAIILEAVTGGISISGEIRGASTGFGFGAHPAVTLHAAGAITETSGTIVAESLEAHTQNNGRAPIILANAGNDVGIVILSALTAPGSVTKLAPGPITFVDSVGFTIASVIGNGVGGLELGIGTAANVVLRAGGPIEEHSVAGVRVAAQNLAVLTLDNGGAAILLTQIGNAIPGNVILGALNAAGKVREPGAIDFVDSTGFNVTAIDTAATATLQAGGALGQTGPIVAQNLVVRTLLDTGATITLTNAGNAIPGNITLSALNTKGTLPAAGPISFVDSTGFTVAAQPRDGLNGQEVGVNTTADASLTGRGISEAAAGVIAATALDITSVGAVSLPGANSVFDLAFTVTGAGNGFLFRNAGRDLTIGFGDFVVSSTKGGAITVAVTGEATAGFDLFVGGRVLSTGGTITLSAGGRGVFSNSGTIDSTSAAKDGNIVVLADGMSLANGRLAAGTAIVVLGPTTATDGIQLGFASPPPGTLRLTEEDLASVTAGQLQIGYRNENGTPSLTGDITIATPISINTAATPSLLLVTGGAVTEAGGASLRAAGAAPLALGIIAGEPVSLAGANAVGTLAGFVGGAGNSFLFRNAGADLRIGALTRPTLGVAFDAGIPSSAVMTGPAPNPLSGVKTAGGNIVLETTTAGDLTLARDVDGHGGLVALVAAGNLAETSNAAVVASGLIADAGRAVALDGANAVGTLSGSAGGAFQFVDTAALTVGSVGPVLEIAAQSGVSTAAGDVRLRTNAGDLTLAKDISAGGGKNNAALVSAGNAVEAGGIVTASNLIVDAVGNVFFGITETGATVALGRPNDVGTLAGRAGGIFGFLNGPALTIGTLPVVLDVAAQSGIAASPAATGDVLIETAGSGQPLTLAANLSAGGRVLLDTAGGFAQRGAVAVTAPVFAVDTMGDGVARLLGVITSPRVDAGVIAGLPPSSTDNPMQFADLLAPNSVVLLGAGRGAVGGTMTVGQLGLSGTGGSADLFGSIAGVGGPTAALRGLRNPGAEATYQFNDCIIASAFCTAQPVPIVSQQPVTVLTAVIRLPVLTATVNLITPETVRSKEPANPDEPVINIFDEERLCAETTNPSQPERERCPEPRPH